MCMETLSDLIKISLEEMHFLGIFEQPRPVLLVQFFLSQNDLDVLSRMVDLALCLVDLGVEVQLDMVGLFQSVRVACEGETAWLDVKLYFRRWKFRYRNSKVDVIFCGIAFRRPLRPKD